MITLTFTSMLQCSCSPCEMVSSKCAVDGKQAKLNLQKVGHDAEKEEVAVIFELHQLIHPTLGDRTMSAA